MPQNKTKYKQKVSLEEFYSHIFTTRWPTLRQALCAATPQVNLRDTAALLRGDYWLDPASLLLADLLPQSDSQTQVDLWDMCAAPGGKMLCLSLRYNALRRNLCFLASELSKARFQRLIRQHALLPEEIRQAVTLKNANACHMALQYKAEGRKFHTILLDAPCSSERHLLQKTSAGSVQNLAQAWSPARSKRNAQNQTALLCSALDCLAPKGVVLYATCSLSPLENAGVVERALKKRSYMHIKALKNTPHALNCEAQEPFGYSILPDRNNGSGPLYFCLLQKPQ